MNRPILTCVFLVFATAALNAQQSSQSDPYQGQSHPPADDVITATQPEEATPAKPPAGKPLVPPAPATAAPQPAPVAPAAPALAERPKDLPNTDDVTGTDDGIVQVAPPDTRDSQPGEPRLSSRTKDDPDGDIVHPESVGPGQLGSGATIRVRLLTGLATAYTEKSEVFRSRVASDVIQDGQVIIPAGAEIDGRVVEVSEGHAGGHGTIRLRPDTVILADGTRYHLDAQVTGAPGTNTNVGSEGTIGAGPRWKKDGLEYGGAVGAGAVAGAMIAGPVGALTGSLIGAGAITVHLLSDHPQVRLEPGTALLITLNSRLNLVASNTANDNPPTN